MHSKASQRGIGLFGILLLIAILAPLAVAVLKLYPGYYEYTKVRTSMNGLSGDSEIGSMSTGTAWRAMEKRLDINGVPTKRVRELKEGFSIQYDKETKKRVVRLAYEFRTSLFLNIDAVLNFDYPIYVNPT